VIGVLVAGGVIAGGVAARRSETGSGPANLSSSVVAGVAEPSARPESSPAPGPARETDPLTGGRVSNGDVIAVKVENITGARPQVGLVAADIVFAEEVEGAQTRLVAVYHTTFPSRVGPVRSARSTDVQLLALFGRPGLVYSGANRSVQGRIDRSDLVPIERSTRDHRRVAPHNVFVNLRRIADTATTGGARAIGWGFAVSDPRWGAAPAVPDPSSRLGADRFDFGYTGGRYVVRWKGQTYRDGDSRTLSVCANVVVMSVHNHGDGNADVNGAKSVMSDTVGQGPVTLYRDGRRLTGTWQRRDLSAPLRFVEGSGRDIPLAPGKTWVLLQG
jgi:hypothetical protein